MSITHISLFMPKKKEQGSTCNATTCYDQNDNILKHDLNINQQKVFEIYKTGVHRIQGHLMVHKFLYRKVSARGMVQSLCSEFSLVSPKSVRCISGAPIHPLSTEQSSPMLPTLGPRKRLLRWTSSSSCSTIARPLGPSGFSDPGAKVSLILH